MSSTSSPKPPLVAVVGTTGVGKSLLGVELARALADVYRGLDVITNKATAEEMNGVPHHLMGFLSPGEEYRVGEFQSDALAKITELEKEGTISIAVGGTAYYLQNLIFPNQLVADAPPPPRPSTPPPTDAAEPPPALKTAEDFAHFPPSLREVILSLPAELLDLFFALPSLPQTSTPDEFPPKFPVDLLPPSYRTPETLTPAVYAILTHVDPASASRWHWRDVRKVRRALEIVWEGRRWEDVRNQQEEKKDEGSRFRSLIFWLYADNKALHPRLDSRVDKMLELGLLAEIKELWALANAEAGETDYSRGIFQTIGYKEFEPYLASRSGASDDNEHDAASDPLFKAGLERMKISTRQYAKRQVKWIQQKLLPAVRKLEEKDVTVVLLDATDLEHWQENVRAPAVELLRTFLRSDPLPHPSSLSPLAAAQLAPPSERSTGPKLTCEACTTDATRPLLVDEHQWDAHRRTRAHQRMQRIKDGTQRVKGPPKLREKAIEASEE
ncbi:IPP transferase-domain-containing protein [Leucosporidium creatinivorum]|uniref:IPP transferase-domain-containing protein n=1 Tax=Leucosporidium creatinivorum TaxID=106004 RepID=A0A1Y2F641_9BASI|nr:IPP transferase-domain-containing protein [Leucosporidium creatinivorum]